LEGNKIIFKLDDRYNLRKKLIWGWINMKSLKLKKMLPLLIILITSVVIITVITYVILYVRPIWQTYSRFEYESIIIYRNEQLDVELSVSKYQGSGEIINPYHAEWGVWDLRGNTTEDLMQSISVNSEHMSEDQFKWFEYMLTHVVE
jgi:hypothetical protein